MNLREPEVRFVGHLITKVALKLDPDKVKADKEMSRPTSKKELLLIKVPAKAIRSRTATERKLSVMEETLG